MTWTTWPVLGVPLKSMPPYVPWRYPLNGIAGTARLLKVWRVAWATLRSVAKEVLAIANTPKVQTLGDFVLI